MQVRKRNLKKADSLFGVKLVKTPPNHQLGMDAAKAAA